MNRKPEDLPKSRMLPGEGRRMIILDWLAGAILSLQLRVFLYFLKVQAQARFSYDKKGEES
ncbi:hypothetical protein [Dehalobacterium formicoaceticum]|uniref:Uncharacterized protein n=1 Tax=Dehalobacterium formicoaceticum TaxID=51515 RepID=A0ABT1Y1Q9_9FIRM|nr:hypothetical protein [Dehalobacterium formicoaceticum]MCR6544799.1 hypothetical protein [Dehalobacterium formicoaceticum]